MTITENKNYYELQSNDQYGEFIFRIHKGENPQIQIEAQEGNSDAYFNPSKEDLIAIRDLISKVIDNL